MNARPLLSSSPRQLLFPSLIPTHPPMPLSFIADLKATYKNRTIAGAQALSLKTVTGPTVILGPDDDR